MMLRRMRSLGKRLTYLRSMARGTVPTGVQCDIGVKIRFPSNEDYVTNIYSETILKNHLLRIPDESILTLLQLSQMEAY